MVYGKLDVILGTVQKAEYLPISENPYYDKNQESRDIKKIGVEASQNPGNLFPSTGFVKVLVCIVSIWYVANKKNNDDDDEDDKI